MAGLVPAISMVGALCPPDRDRWDKPGDLEPARHEFCFGYILMRWPHRPDRKQFFCYNQPETRGSHKQVGHRHSPESPG
jgi:hypothetical protein